MTDLRDLCEWTLAQSGLRMSGVGREIKTRRRRARCSFAESCPAQLDESPSVHSTSMSHLHINTSFFRALLLLPYPPYVQIRLI